MLSFGEIKQEKIANICQNQKNDNSNEIRLGGYPNGKKQAESKQDANQVFYIHKQPDYYLIIPINRLNYV